MTEKNTIELWCKGRGIPMQEREAMYRVTERDGKYLPWALAPNYPLYWQKFNAPEKGYHYVLLDSVGYDTEAEAWSKCYEDWNRSTKQ